MKDINKRVKEVRSHASLTQKAFADILGVKWYQVKDIETGKTKVSIEIISAICEKFSVNSDWLLIGRGSLLDEERPAQDQSSNITVIKHQGLVTRFRNPEKGLLNNERLIDIESVSPRLYDKLTEDIQKVHETAMIIKEDIEEEQKKNGQNESSTKKRRGNGK